MGLVSSRGDSCARGAEEDEDAVMHLPHGPIRDSVSSVYIEHVNSTKSRLYFAAPVRVPPVFFVSISWSSDDL